MLVVNSSSGDGTVELAQSLGAETLTVARPAFNHGLTRELARRRLGTGIVVMLSPDAYPRQDDFVERLTEPLRQGRAAVAYGRQVAGEDASFLERVGREFNYPAASHIRGAADWSEHGSYLRFCSNACAAWSNAALDRIGGFKPTLVSEETIAVAELLARGERIAYVAEAEVEHSHSYDVADAFRRQFDIGYSRRIYDWLLLAGEGDEPVGGASPPRCCDVPGARRPPSCPASSPGSPPACSAIVSVWPGTVCRAALARRLSGQDYFWTSDVAIAGGGALAPV